jgi:hypothetical protein
MRTDQYAIVYGWAKNVAKTARRCAVFLHFDWMIFSSCNLQGTAASESPDSIN